MVSTSICHNECDLSELLNSQRLEGYSKLLIVARAGKRLHTNLTNFQLPASMASILVVSQSGFKKLMPVQKVMFSFIIVYTVNENEVIPWRSLNKAIFPSMSTVITQLATAVNSAKLYLCVTEEHHVRWAADMRGRLRLAGSPVDLADVARFCDKLVMKECAQRANLSLSKHFLLNADMVPNDQQEAEQLVNSIVNRFGNEDINIFAKPVCGCGSVGATSLQSKETLTNWLLQTFRERPAAYLLEEFIAGTEYAVYALVSQNKPLMLRIFKNRWPLRDFVAPHLKPIAKIEVSLSDPTYPKYAAFVHKVMDAFSPLPDGFFSLQFFDDEAAGRLALIEVCIRLPGGLFTELHDLTMGESVESAHFLGAISEFQADNFSQQRSPCYGACIRYPRKAGTVRQLNKTIEQEVSSSIRCQWLVKPDDHLNDARGVAARHEVMNIIIWNDNFEHLEADYNRICDSYEPCVLGP